MQRNFDPMRIQVERWRVQQLSAEAAKLTIYHRGWFGRAETPRFSWLGSRLGSLICHTFGQCCRSPKSSPTVLSLVGSAIICWLMVHGTLI
jgi:hypothetical protein